MVTGNWLVDGNPLIVLFDVTSASWNLDRYKNELFQKSGIGIPHLDAEANDAVVFGYMTAQFIVEVRKFETSAKFYVTKSFDQSMSARCLEIYKSCFYWFYSSHMIPNFLLNLCRVVDISKIYLYL